MKKLSEAKILVLDDSPAILELFRCALTFPVDEGGLEIPEQNVFLCSTLQEALRTLREKNETEFSWNLVITDLNIPSGLEGNMMARAAKQLAPQVPVLMMSGTTNKSELDTIESLKHINAIDDFVEKPFNGVRYLQTIILKCLGIEIPRLGEEVTVAVG